MLSRKAARARSARSNAGLAGGGEVPAVSPPRNVERHVRLKYVVSAPINALKITAMLESGRKKRGSCGPRKNQKELRAGLVKESGAEFRAAGEAELGTPGRRVLLSRACSFCT